MEYFVSDKFVNMKRIGNPYEKNGKLYTAVQDICDRCQNGVYVCRVENNQPIPHPAYGGVCLKCGGTGYIKMEARLYTAKEKAAADRAKARAQERREEELERREQEIRANAAAHKIEWLEKNGYGEGELTWVVIGDSYPVKDQLKEMGCRYDAVRGWYAPAPLDVPAGLGMVSIHVDKLIDFNYRGDGYYKTEAKAYVDSLKEGEKTPSTSEWYGTPEEKFEYLPVTVIRISGCHTRFGWSNIYTFKHEENILTWFTSTEQSFNVGDTFYISGTIKAHEEYKGEKTTSIKRVKVKEKK